MIVVDSSIWIDWFRKGLTEDVADLVALTPAREILVGDIVLLEVLQGARNERHARSIQTRMLEFPVVRMLDPRLAAKAAANYRRLREIGVTIRTTADLIIGTFCIERGHSLLQNDRDFLPMAEHLGLRLA